MEATTTPLVSVVVRTFDEERGLPRLFASLRRQRGVHFEVIVVDSGSRDRTCAIAQASIDPPVRLLRIVDFTYGRALNLGLEASRAPFVAFLSAHTELLHPDWLAAMHAACAAPRIAAAVSRQMPWPDSPWWERAYTCWLYGRQIRVPGLPPSSFNNASSMIRRACWVARRFDESLPACEDFDWALAMRREGYEVAWVPEVAARHSHQETPSRFLSRRAREGRALLRILVAGQRSDGIEVAEVGPVY